MHIELDPPQIELITRARDLARKSFAPRAPEYDRTAAFPAEDFKDLFSSGLLAAVVPREHGGLGLGPYRGDVLTLWLITKEIAKADLSLARCWEGHCNSLVLLDGMGTPEQKGRWFNGVVNKGETWVAWSGEPQARASSETMKFGTNTTKVEGGWVVEGNKAFATSAGGAQWAILLVSTAGPGGDSYLYAHYQVDAQATMRLASAVSVMVYGLNLNNEVFGFYNGSPQYTIQREFYNRTFSFGLRWVPKF